MGNRDQVSHEATEGEGDPPLEQASEKGIARGRDETTDTCPGGEHQGAIARRAMAGNPGDTSATIVRTI